MHTVMERNARGKNRRREVHFKEPTSVPVTTADEKGGRFAEHRRIFLRSGFVKRKERFDLG
jgi:hypothetical protein